VQVRGNGRVFRRPNSIYFSCAYYLHGKEHRESTGKTDEKEAWKYLHRRLIEVGADKMGIKKFAGPKAERIDISCGIINPDQRKADCDCLCCCLERYFRRHNKASAPTLCVLKRVLIDFALKRAISLTSAQVDAYIDRCLAEGAAPTTVNRRTQILGQAFNLAIENEDLISAPVIHHLSEAENVRKGFRTAAEFEAIVSNLPEYLQDYVHWDYRTGMRKKQIDSLLWEHQEHDRDDIIRSMAEDVKTRKPHSIELDEELTGLIQRRRAARQVTMPDGTVEILPLHLPS